MTKLCMDASSGTSGMPQTISLVGDLGIRDIIDLHEQLCKVIEGGGPVHIDLNMVTKLDITIVQLLIATQQDARHRGNDFRLSAMPNGPLAQVMAAAGLNGSDGEITGCNDCSSLTADGENDIQVWA